MEASNGHLTTAIVDDDESSSKPMPSCVQPATGEPVVDDPRTTSRNERGQFAIGNSVGKQFVAGRPGPALRHGLRSRLVRQGLAHADGYIDVLRGREAAILADLGGRADITAIKGDLVVRFVETSAIADHLGRNIVENGVLTTKGRTRAAVKTYLQVVDRLQALARIIGLERQARSVTFADAVRAAGSESTNE